MLLVLRRFVLFVLAVLVLGQSGCATKVLGPGNTSAPGPLGFIVGTVSARRPVDFGFGPAVGPSAAYQRTLSRAIEQSVFRARFGETAGQTVYVHGWDPTFVPRSADRSQLLRSVALIRYVAAEAAVGAVRRGAKLVHHPERADLWILPRIEIAGAQTTEREYRVQQYPIYHHYEDHGQAAITLLLYDRRKSKLVDLVTGRNRRLAFDSYFLDIFGVRFRF
ncbi:hypothetical protein ACFL59_02295 [Planctomycetota bacterium]